VQLIVCTHEAADGKAFLAPPIVVPSLAARAKEIGRIVDEYASDAVRSLAAEEPLGPEDRGWILANSASSLPEIAKATRRLVAIRKEGSFAAAAELLGMSHTSLSRWVGRRTLPAVRSS
jgi:hypothetical protein